MKNFFKIEIKLLLFIHKLMKKKSFFQIPSNLTQRNFWSIENVEIRRLK